MSDGAFFFAVIMFFGVTSTCSTVGSIETKMDEQQERRLFQRVHQGPIQGSAQDATGRSRKTQ